MTIRKVEEGVIVEWNEPAQNGNATYRLYRYQRGFKSERIADIKAAITKNYTNTTAKKGQLYFYYLASVSEDGIESSPGEEEGIWP